jgi:hypothetical protein
MRRFQRGGVREVKKERVTPRRNPDTLERVMGIEPTPSAWEAEVLPLNYTRCMIPSTFARFFFRLARLLS